MWRFYHSHDRLNMSSSSWDDKISLFKFRIFWCPIFKPLWASFCLNSFLVFIFLFSPGQDQYPQPAVTTNTKLILALNKQLCVLQHKQRFINKGNSSIVCYSMIKLKANRITTSKSLSEMKHQNDCQYRGRPCSCHF